MPLDTRVFYLKMKKIMVVGARDMVLIQKVKQIDRDTSVIVVKSVEKLTDEKHPVSDTKELQRAVVHLGGYLLQRETANQTKLTVLCEMDYKIATFMAKNVGPKAGNVAKMVRDYVQKEGL